VHVLVLTNKWPAVLLDSERKEKNLPSPVEAILTTEYTQHLLAVKRLEQQQNSYGYCKTGVSGKKGNR